MTPRWLVPLVLGAVWVLLTDNYDVANLAFGLVIGLVALWPVRDLRAPGPVRVRPLKVGRLLGLFVVKLAQAAVRVLVLALSPRPALHPGLITVPLRVDRDFQIALLANLITLTPGTLSVDVSADRRHLVIHCLDARDADATISEIRDGFEARILEAFA